MSLLFCQVFLLRVVSLLRMCDESLQYLIKAIVVGQLCVTNFLFFHIWGDQNASPHSPTWLSTLSIEGDVVLPWNPEDKK